MKLLVQNSPEFRLTLKVLLLFLSFAILFLSFNYWFMKEFSLSKAKQNLSKTLTHIRNDIQYSNGTWDTTKYIQDTNTPLDKPLYIITAEGFIIERMNPIPGFLDTSNINYMLTFTEPQTITSPSNTNWRIYTQPIMKNNNLEGAILTAYYDPPELLLNKIDQELLTSAQYIQNLLEFKNNTLETNKIHSKDIPHTIYYSIIDKFNRVLTEDGGPPAFIDRSFFANQLNTSKPHVILGKNNDPFLVSSLTITDRSNTPVGIIIAAEPLKDIFEIVAGQRNFSILFGLLIMVFMVCTLFIIFAKDLQKIAYELFQYSTLKKYDDIHSIYFDQKQAMVMIDTNAVCVEYGSKQYDLCRCLFSYPKKRWEYDELIEKNHMAENNHASKIFYDAALRLNHKIQTLIGTKLIIYENKTFQLNPMLLQKIIKQ